MSKLKNFQALLVENGFDAAIITDQLNQHYLSGFEFHDGVVLVLQKDAYLITDFRYVEAAKENADPDMQVITPEKGATDAICTLLGEHNCARVAIEEDILLAWPLFHRPAFQDKGDHVNYVIKRF